MPLLVSEPTTFKLKLKSKSKSKKQGRCWSPNQQHLPSLKRIVRHFTQKDKNDHDFAITIYSDFHTY